MIDRVHLFLIKYMLKPFYISKFKPFIYVGTAFRKVFIFIFKCDISPYAHIPWSTKFPHYIGIVIGACTFGENCIISQNVTIGAKHRFIPSYKDARKTIEERRSLFPVIGSGVDVGANSCILGNIKIGSNSIIGAGSVVVKDVDPDSVYCGVPAQKIKTRD